MTGAPVTEMVRCFVLGPGWGGGGDRAGDGRGVKNEGARFSCLSAVRVMDRHLSHSSHEIGH